MTIKDVSAICDIPDDAHHELTARAAGAGESSQEDERAVVRDHEADADVDDVLLRARARLASTGSRVTVESILEARDADRA